MKINILLCDTFPGLLPANIPSYQWMYTHLFDKVYSGIEYKIYESYNDQFPTDITSSEIYLITGSNVSAYDDIAWVKHLKEWVVKAAKQQAKIVGICFGHQLIAEALGGKVERANAWGIGIRESRIVDERFLSLFPNGKMRLLYNHHDQVAKLPKNATLVATSDFCKHEAYHIGNNIIAIQGHPEFSEEYEMHLLKDFPNDGESEEVKSQALLSMTKHEPQNSLVAKIILSFFEA